ncbi:MAG: sporulation protein YabP [Lachnospira sp.]|nr:sporulation protein YabP [Lachnospira sp.]
MEDKMKLRKPHSVHMENRSKMVMTGITDVVSFDPCKVVLESDYGAITIKGSDLHVNRLSVDKGELDVDGTVTAFEYSQMNNYATKSESLFNRLFK